MHVTIGFPAFAVFPGKVQEGIGRNGESQDEKSEDDRGRKIIW